MLEDKIYKEEGYSEDYGGHHNQQGRALQLIPRRPRGLLGQLNERLFQIVNKLSHLYF